MIDVTINATLTLGTLNNFQSLTMQNVALLNAATSNGFVFTGTNLNMRIRGCVFNNNTGTIFNLGSSLIGSIDINNIDSIIEQFLEILSPYLVDKQKREIYHQIERILAQFTALKRDVSNVSLEVLDESFIPDIIMDLRSVIIQTEKSVSSILDIADDLSGVCQRISDPKIREELMIKSTRILEICNFQDLTGQRIQKIVHHLTEVESIIHKMLHALHPEISLRIKHSRTDQSLINGPQKDTDSTSQNDIDDLFNSL